MISQLRERLAAAREVRDRLAGLVGSGESADGAVRAECTDNDGLTALVINPRALRLGSEELAERVLQASRVARTDLEERKRAESGPGFDPREQFDPAALRAQLDDAAATFARTSYDVTSVVDLMRRATGR